MNYKEIWQKLSAIDCTAHVEKKNSMNYLSWAWAWGTLMEHYPEATYSFDPPQTFPDNTVMVFCTVNIGECSRKMWLPVMDHRNKAIQNPDSFAINTSMMRCLVKCLAMYGLAHYIFAGEDLPQAELERLYSPITEEQAMEIHALIARLDGNLDIGAFMKFFGISVISNLKQSDFQKAKMALEKKLEAVA